MPNRYLHLLNLDTVGGVEELFIHFLTHSARMGSSQHHVLVTAKPPHPFFTGRLKSLTASQVLEKYAFGFKLLKWLRPLQRKRALLQARPHTIVLWNRIEELATLKKTCPKAKIVYYEHGASWMHPMEDKTFEFFKQVDQFLVNSHAAKRMLELKWHITKPITIISNPLKPTVIQAQSPKSYAPNSPFIIGFIGRLIPLKGLPLLLHALKILVDQKLPVTLQIAGDGSMKKRLEHEIERLQLSHHVTFLGCIHDVSCFYDTIDLLAMPSIREPLGLVAQEAAYRGCPVIASHVDGLAEVVVDGKTGYRILPTLDVSMYPKFGGTCDRLPDMVYNPGTDTLAPAKLVDPQAFAEKIQALMNDSSLYNEMSLEAISFAKQRPTFKHYSEALLQALSE